jgi:hypothetical protein
VKTTTGNTGNTGNTGKQRKFPARRKETMEIATSDAGTLEDAPTL